MSKVGREIAQIKFHDIDFVISGLGVVPPQLPSRSKTFALEMRHDEHGAFIKIDDHECLVPWANIKYILYKK